MKSTLLFLGLISLFACTQSIASKGGNGPVFIKKTNTNPNVVAKFLGKEITLDLLDFENRMKIYEAQREAVDSYVRQMVLDDLAKKDKVKVEEYIDKHKDKIADKDVESFLKERVQDISRVPKDVKERVRGILYVQKLVHDKTEKEDAELYLQRPQPAPLEFDKKFEVASGKEDAPVTIVEFSDFQCPYCSKGKDRLSAIKKEFGKKVRVVFKHLPLPMHPDARPAAEASLCVNEQSSDKFWKYHDILFENQDKLSESDLGKYAEKVGVDKKKFEDCFKAKKYAAHVEANMAEASHLGINATPAFFINNYPIQGARDMEVFQEIINEQLAKAK